ncbi:MAG TPA: AI-2E family transporter [Gemmatimonadaceae bacterium]|nr:AI-2E family transporter [Gemmatimonadaceae bacterium]
MTDPTRDPARDLQRGPAGDPDANATRPERRGTVPPPSVGRGRVRHDRAVGWRSRDIVRTAALVLAMYLLVRLIWFANALFLTVFLGALFAIAVSAGVDRLQRFRIPRGIGAALIVLAFFGLLAAFGAWVTPTLRTQGTELRQKLPEAIDRVESWLKKEQDGMLGIFLGKPAPTPPATNVGTPAASPGASPTVPSPEVRAAVDSAFAAAARDTASHGAPPLQGRIQEQLGGVTKFLFPFAKSTLAAVGGLLLVVFLSIYFATDPELYRRGMLALLPPRRRHLASRVMSRVAHVLRKWLVTQLIAMAVIGGVSTIALLILRVKAAFALGLLAGLFEFIPTVGPILSAVPAVAMGFLDSPEKALLIAVVYIGIQFLENHILIPLLMKGGMDLPPALTVITQALLALVFGFLGLMVAVPLLATVMVIVQMLYVDERADAPARSDDADDGHDPDLDEPLSASAPAAG